uniref:Uncharacterized protein n=1 Tax=Rhipicephalus zambeziensis TaxID=60191 RepID=A0A224YGX6_9ACAR
MPEPRGSEPTGLDSAGVALLVAFIAADEAVVCVGPVRTLPVLALPARNFISGLWGLTACENETRYQMNGSPAMQVTQHVHNSSHAGMMFPCHNR